MNKIGPFILDNHKPTTMRYGTYYSTSFMLPFHKLKRTIRVWLPEDYDFKNPNKRFPVFYFSDGQNLVDRNLSAYGEWELDRTLHKIYEETGKSTILVGIDCPKVPYERFLELNPPYPLSAKTPERKRKEIGFVNKYIDYIKDYLKPLIDSLFFTLPDKEHTGIGGSSMGGIMAFFAYMYAPETFGMSLSFSPAFFAYTKRDWARIMDIYDMKPEKNGKVFLYTGGKDFEEMFYKPTINTFEYMKKRGFKDDQVHLLFDSSEIHHEAAWAKYSYDAFKFLLGD